MKNLTLVVTILLILPFTFLSADETQKKEQDTTSVRKYEIPELMIMAPKQSTQIRLMPSSISVMESETIRDNSITSLNDVTAFAPNFFMPDYGSKLTSPVYIRGIGSRINSPSVGLNVDHVPYFEKAAFDFDMFDIERIEVLRGPQGTLYGRNTMGGLINIYTKSPSVYQGTEFLLNTGSYGYYNGLVSHYQKISDEFSFSANANYISEDGYFTNTFNDEKVDGSSSIGSRIRFVWDIDDKNTLENITNMERSEQGGYPYAKFDTETGMAGDINYNEYSYYDRDMISNALVYKYKGDRYELHSTSAYQYLDDKNGIDQDFSPNSLYYVVQTQDQNMFSQEFIVKSKYKENYNWLCGGYGFYQGFVNHVDVDVYSRDTKVLKDYDHEIFGGAAFHESTMSNFLVEDLSITTGIRLDYEMDELQYKENSFVKEVHYPKADTTYQALTSFQILPKLAFKYEFDYTTNAYISISRGYKTGGFNTVFERTEDLTFDPEYSWNYEIGYKTSLFENKVIADMAVFYIDWKNQQIYRTVPSGRGSMLKNAGSSTSKGFELSMRAEPVKDLETMLSFGYTDAAFEDYVKDSLTNYSGNTFPNVPLFTMSLRAGKLFRFMSGFVEGIKINASYNLIGDIFWNEKNTASQEKYGLVDGNISIRTELFNIDFWFKNLLDTQYNAFYFEALGSSFVQRGRPRTFGVQLSAKI